MCLPLLLVLLVVLRFDFMHLSQCLNPKRIFSQYENAFIYVPCGKCEACRNSHANMWIQRLHAESQSWKYTAFVTLTYDNESLPRMSSADGITFVPDMRRLSPYFGVVMYNIDYIFCRDNISNDECERNRKWLQQLFNEDYNIPHLSPYDLQKFFKRLRKNLITVYKKNGKKFTDSDCVVRYYAVGEYGETTYRPHYHVLFYFSSKLQSMYFQDALLASWKYGSIDFSYVKGDASQYVAAYVNSFANIPILLQQRYIRPFAVCSKNPPLGTLAFRSEKIQELFNSCSSTMLFDDAKRNTVLNIPLWRSLKDRIFPRLSFFSKLSYSDRVALYRVVQRFEAFFGEVSVSLFVANMLTFYNSSVRDSFMIPAYWNYYQVWDSVESSECTKLYDFLIRWYYVSNRVCKTAAAFGVTVQEYVRHIQCFYDNCDKDELKQYFHWQEDYSNEYGAVSLIGVDLEFLLEVMALDDMQVTDSTRMLLKGYGVDLDKFFSSDLSIRLSYRESLIPQSQHEYLSWFRNQTSIATKRVKNKKKNDYLLSHGNSLLNKLSNF